MSKLTIVIDNIPEGEFDDMWDTAVRKARSAAGVPVAKTDMVMIDYSVITQNYPSVADKIVPPMMSGIFTCHLMCEADKILNK